MKPFNLERALAGDFVYTEGATGKYLMSLKRESAESSNFRHLFIFEEQEGLHEFVVCVNDYATDRDWETSDISQ